MDDELAQLTQFPPISSDTAHHRVDGTGRCIRCHEPFPCAAWWELAKERTVGAAPQRSRRWPALGYAALAVLTVGGIAGVTLGGGRSTPPRRAGPAPTVTVTMHQSPAYPSATQSATSVPAGRTTGAASPRTAETRTGAAPTGAPPPTQGGGSAVVRPPAPTTRPPAPPSTKPKPTPTPTPSPSGSPGDGLCLLGLICIHVH